MKRIILALLLLAIPASASAPGTAIACGTSPCVVTTTAIAVLNPNPSRQSCVLMPVGGATLFCTRATLALSPASSSSYDFVLQGNTYTCDSPYSVWRGAINCIANVASSAPTLSIEESQ